MEYEIYVHIPFCVRKCKYCDFLSFSADETTKDRYVKALVSEIRTKSELLKKDHIRSVYFGGGTPSCLEAAQLSQIMGVIQEEYHLSKDCEISIEVNPGTVDLCKFIELKKAGFNRLSIGMQSMDDEELRLLGRIHDRAAFEDSYRLGRQAGFDNINVDVMTALPNQNKEKLIKTLKQVVELNPEHISAYSLILEEGTSFYDFYEGDRERIMSEKEERQLYWFTVDYLEAAGYEHYEISNFARRSLEVGALEVTDNTGQSEAMSRDDEGTSKNYRSRHNSGYWTRVPYLGFGLGASSLYINADRDEERSRNLSSLEEYLDDSNTKDEVIVLSEEDRIEEFMFLGLRMLEGVSERKFKEVFGKTIDELYGKVISKLVNDGLIERSDNTIRLTSKGVDYGNYVFSCFLL